MIITPDTGGKPRTAQKRESMERAEAMRASLVLDGEWGGHFTEEQSN
jgi:hypothetical protein